jgi:hypothetical protein
MRRRPAATRAAPLTPPAQPGSGERLGLERFATSQDVVIVRVCVGKWQAIIHHDGERKPLGYFDDEQEAAQTFDAAARRLRGDDAHGGYAGFNKLRLNFPTPRERGLAEGKAERRFCFGIETRHRTEKNHGSR